MTDPRSVLIRLTPRLKLRLLLLLVLFVLIQLLVFYLGTQYGTAASADMHQRQRELTSQLNKKSQVVKRQKADLVRISKSAEVDRLAAEQVRQELFALRAENASLQKDVEFYKGLMAPDERDKGLKLHAFTLVHNDTTGRYGFRLVMANVGGKGRVVKGTMRLDLKALNEGTLQTQSLTDLPGYSGSKPIKLRFRFFQNIEGEFDLPDGLQPTELVVSANVNDSSGEPFSVSYRWQELLQN